MLNLLPHETADDPRAYRAERAAYERARRLSALLVRATGGHEEARPRLDLAAEARARAASIQHFAALARRYRAELPAWQPSAFLLRSVEARGFSWREVEEQLR